MKTTEPTSKHKLIAVLLPAALHARLLDEAKEKDTDKSKIVREALRRRLGV